MTGQQVKNLLKEAGIDTRKVSVRVTPSSYNVTLKSWAISRSKVESLLSFLQEIHRCEATGEILSGCNTFVFVDYGCKEELPAKLIESAKAQKWQWTDQNNYSNKMSNIIAALAEENLNYDTSVCYEVVKTLACYDESFKAYHGL